MTYTFVLFMVLLPGGYLFTLQSMDEGDGEEPALYEAIATDMTCDGNNYLLSENICLDCCARKCSRRKDCVGFVYTICNDDKPKCQLKKDVVCEKEVPAASSVIYRKIVENFPVDQPDFVKTTQKPPINTWDELQVAPTDFTLEKTGFDCPGNNLRTENIEFGRCANKCRHNNPCIGFVFTLNPDSKTSCQLKEDLLCDNPVPQPDTVVYSYDVHVVADIASSQDILDAGKQSGFGKPIDE